MLKFGVVDEPAAPRLAPDRLVFLLELDVVGRARARHRLPVPLDPPQQGVRAVPPLGLVLPALQLVGVLAVCWRVQGVEEVVGVCSRGIRFSGLGEPAELVLPSVRRGAHGSGVLRVAGVRVRHRLRRADAGVQRPFGRRRPHPDVLWRRARVWYGGVGVRHRRSVPVLYGVEVRPGERRGIAGIARTGFGTSAGVVQIRRGRGVAKRHRRQRRGPVRADLLEARQLHQPRGEGALVPAAVMSYVSSYSRMVVS